ncbi:hypothetical protein HMI56_002806 [Coelomomyces lativittatus]|nr:hypothetical protein HMI56_002806 [Coelomomyces lativittatus]
MEQEAKQLVSQESTQSLERKPQEGSGNNIPIEHKVQSYGQTGRQFQAPGFDDLPSPTQQEQATRGAPMDWFSSNRLNPFVLPVYEGGSFHAPTLPTLSYQGKPAGTYQDNKKAFRTRAGIRKHL